MGYGDEHVMFWGKKFLSEIPIRKMKEKISASFCTEIDLPKQLPRHIDTAPLPEHLRTEHPSEPLTDIRQPETAFLGPVGIFNGS